MTNYIKAVCEIEGLAYESSHSLTGGDINDAYSVTANKNLYFLKVNAASAFPLMFNRETEGLNALQQQTSLKVPGVLATGELEGKQYLLLEWLEKGTPGENFWEAFAQGMVALHTITNPFFGWTTSNYIGSLVQQNEYNASWPAFYALKRVMPLAENLFDQTLLEKTDLKATEKICARLNEIFPEEQPSLLHGDLWSGNFMAAKGDNPADIVPAVYDPAVYYGHREMDLGMSLLFGGFNSRFYDAYHSFFPLEHSWKKRVPLTQLYPLLVHAVLFKGGYINQCKTILKNWGGI